MRRLRLALAGVAAVAGIATLVLPEPSDDARLADLTAAGVPAAVSGRLPDSARQVRLIASEAHEQTVPVRVRIPAIGVDSPLLELGVDDAGALAPPEDFARAGWFAGGPVPGEIGPSVIAGHVDSYEGPAVFFRLDALRPGDDVLVDLSDGSTVPFTVSDSDRYPKDRFPTEEVYGPTPRAELRLITCGGAFDRDRRSYLDNVVVTAVHA